MLRLFTFPTKSEKNVAIPLLQMQYCTFMRLHLRGRIEVSYNRRMRNIQKEPGFVVREYRRYHWCVVAFEIMAFKTKRSRSMGTSRIYGSPHTQKKEYACVEGQRNQRYKYVNVFELRSPGGVDGLFLRGLYMVASIMAHDCRGNTHLTVDHNFQLTVYASLPIQQGETVFFNYTSSFLGTSGRREHLRGGKYFECECSLCKDPYEMGSYMSCILCPQCRQGYIGIQNPLAINPYEKSMRWQCNRCRRSIGGRLVRTTLNISRTLIEDTDGSDVKSLETLATKLIRSFHPNHFVMLSLKQKLLAAYRKEMATPNPSKKCMQRMLETCKEVCDVLEIVEPGISRLKAIMLYEMHLPLMLLANRAYAAREISLAELSSRLEEAGSLLKRSLGMLLLEPVDTPEGKLAKRALHELKALNQNIADVKMITAVEDKCSHDKRKSSKHKSNTNK
ncbi:uncharacterized protein LOC143360216 isoform X3 [Halictus rubicundus]|uniref:uncharacterized protein LOC143360216 isoform X3 n=1 Tax=Halictus rubicundus TaxID=77578 RepID=UPI0040367595